MLRLWWSELLVVSAPTLQYTATCEYHVSIFYWRSLKSMKANTEFNLCQHTGCCIVVEQPWKHRQSYMHAQTYTHISIFTLVCMQVLTHTNTLPHNLNSFVHVKRHVNINAFKWRDASECIIWQSLTYSISSPRKNKDRPSNAAAETHRLFNHWFLSQTEISILSCNTSKDPSTLSKSISNHFQPSTDAPPPVRHSISTPHLFHLQHQRVFIPCPLQNSVPSLDLSDWLCADPAKKQRHSLRFNYSCAMRGSGFSPLQAKKHGLLH